jgi:hypothetical protein
LIASSDPAIVAAYIKRADRRPKGWKLVIHRQEHVVHSEAQGVRSASDHGVQVRQRGVQRAAQRGAASAPESSLTRPRTHPTAESADRSRLLPPPCGLCDGRRNDPVSARVIWLDESRDESKPCPRCNPRSSKFRG